MKSIKNRWFRKPTPINKLKQKYVVKEKSKSELIRQADALHSEWVRKDSMDWKEYILCYTCDKLLTYGKAQCSHFRPRGNMSTRFDPRNTKAACKDCNEVKEGNLGVYEERLRKELGDVEFEAVVALSNELKVFPTQKLIQIIKERKQWLKEL